MVKQEKFNKGHKAMKKLDGAQHEQAQTFRECLNILFEEAGIDKPVKLKELNNLFN